MQRETPFSGGFPLIRPNKMLEKLRAGDPAFGTFIALGSPLGAEQLGHIGFDWLVIEREHHAIGTTLTQQLLQAISTTETVPLIRVPSSDTLEIRSALDAGAYGVVVPMVNSREQAEQVVQAGRYPPEGVRGVGGARRTLYGGSDYLARANDEIALIVMIEHIDAVSACRDILSVPGIDAWFLGPSDLCASMGLEPTWDPQYPEFLEAVEHVKAVGRELAVPGGIHTTEARVSDIVAAGFQFVAIGYDISFMAAGARNALAAARGEARTDS